MARNGMNKRGFESLLYKVMGLIITAVVVVLLFLLISKTYALVKDRTEEQKIKTQMEKIVVNTNKIYEEGGETRIELFSPVGWYLRTFPDYDFPPGACKRAVGCVCICKELDCSSVTYCEPFSFDVQLIHFTSFGSAYHSDSVEDRRHGGIVDSIEREKQEGTLEFAESLYEIKIIKEGDVVRLFTL
ncbi:MAG: hypothetical protein RL557_182 [archaeon]|jgi:hypothetical protein